ncbi:MAG: hypothetical protein EBU96_08975 [Actinobacteria bacterium]|nr:hypothetical protein [Actinomycetota bacterium]
MAGMAVSKSTSLEPLIHYIPFEKPVGREIVLVARKSLIREKDLTAFAELIRRTLEKENKTWSND